MLTGKLADIAAGLYDLGAVKIDTKEGFKLKLHERTPEAPYSPIFFNLRTRDNPKEGPLTAEIAQMMGEVMFDMVRDTMRIAPDIICGIPRAGEPFTDVIERCFAKLSPGHTPERVWLEKKEEEGKRTVIANPGSRVKPRECFGVLFDDLITQADSKIEAVFALDSLSCTVRDIFVFMDREQGGSFTLAKLGINLHAATKATEIIQWGRENGRICAADADFAIGYIRGSNAGVAH